jgi:hypothetical protein
MTGGMFCDCLRDRKREDEQEVFQIASLQIRADVGEICQ